MVDGLAYIGELSEEGSKSGHRREWVVWIVVDTKVLEIGVVSL